VFISHTIHICLASNGNRLANIAGTETSACLQFHRSLAAGEAGALPGMRTPPVHGRAPSTAARPCGVVSASAAGVGNLAVRTTRRRPTRPPPYSCRSTRPPLQSHQSTRPPPILGYSRLDLRVGEKGRIAEEDRWKGRRWGTGFTGATNSREDPGVRKERLFILFGAGTHNTSVLAMATL
jgi:hypothetical protein